MNTKTDGVHYDFKPMTEVIQLIEDIQLRECIPAKARYSIGTALKYLMRCGRKSGESWSDDVAKAENYLHRAITGRWVKEKGDETD